MGYTIEVSRAEAARAVKRGVAEIVVLDPGGWTVEDEEGDAWGTEHPVFREPLQALRVSFLSATVSIGDARGEAGDRFWAHCSHGGTLGGRLRACLDGAGIKYRVV